MAREAPRVGTLGRSSGIALTTLTSDGVLFTVRLTPRAGRSGMDGVAADAGGCPLIKIRVPAPPVDGAANTALVAFVATALEVAKSSVAIVAGHGSRIKRVALTGDPATLARLVAAWVDLKS